MIVPYLLHQAWGFVSPGLYLREKRFAVPLLLSSVALFYLGMVFAYFAVFPLVFKFFALFSAGLSGVSMMTDINHYLDFVMKMFFAFGVAFEVPVATVLLAMTGLTSARAMARKRPYVIVGCFVVGMLLTPPERDQPSAARGAGVVALRDRRVAGATGRKAGLTTPAAAVKPPALPAER